ncbi:MAG: DUF5610 domain-containing protein [Oceanobacter sp.]
MTRVERQSAEATAANILGFVARGIDSLRSNGADEERLNERLEAARAGVEKGYLQASDQLEALGLMDDALEADIQNSHSLVNQALTDLSSLKAFAAGDSSNTTQANTSVSQQTSHTEQLSFDVLTRDGDRVTVSFNSQQEMNSSGSNGRYSFSAFEDKQFNFAVNGQLDDAELGALNDLFKQVNSLSKQFFEADLGAALQQAMEIGYDATELASFSLNLYQSSQIQTSVSQRQGYPITQAQLPTPELESLKAPLMNYVDSFLSALEKTSPFADGLKLIAEITDKFLDGKRSDTALNSVYLELNNALARAKEFKS